MTTYNALSHYNGNTPVFKMNIFGYPANSRKLIRVVYKMKQSFMLWYCLISVTNSHRIKYDLPENFIELLNIRTTAF